LTFFPLVTGTLPLNGVGAWSADNSIYTAIYNLAVAGVAQLDVTVGVTGTQPANSNPQQDFTSQPIFSTVNSVTLK